MGSWLPAHIDMPMGLGDHLHELRRHIMRPLLVLAVAFISAFAFQAHLKDLMIGPYRQAIRIVGAETAAKVGLPADGIGVKLVVQDIGESALSAATVALAVAIAATLPVLLWGLWRFVAVGLNQQERRLAFIFVPLGVICFYIGTLAGYFAGLPYMYAFLIDYTALDGNVVFQLRLREYVDSFLFWTICFGLVMDIPWLVIVLVRVGMVTPTWLAINRKYVAVINLILAACITPTSDAVSLLAMFIPMQLLFEIGLIVSRFMVPTKPMWRGSDA